MAVVCFVFGIVGAGIGHHCIPAVATGNGGIVYAGHLIIMSQRRLTIGLDGDPLRLLTGFYQAVFHVGALLQCALGVMAGGCQVRSLNVVVADGRDRNFGIHGHVFAVCTYARQRHRVEMIAVLLTGGGACFFILQGL